MKIPDWSLLPHRPREFFELSETAGRAELKRAYARLVKQFKPEACPDEFMRIRGAYEEFDRALAYGLEETPRDAAPPEPPPPSPEPPAAPVPADEAPGRAGDPAPPPPPSVPAPAAPSETRLPTPPGASRPLSLRRPVPGSAPAAPPGPATPPFARTLLACAKAGRASPPDLLAPQSPDDFIHLAFFREAMAEAVEDEILFFNTLLEGLKQFPRDRALIEALRKFFTALEDVDAIPPCLEQARWWLPSGVFFYVTEAAWFHLGRLSGGETASALLREFMRAEPGDPAQSVFLLRFLRRHFDAVDPVWFAECLDLLMERLGEDETGGNDELDFLVATLDFIRMPDELREEYPVLNEIRAILELVCRGEAEANMARIYGFYRKLADLENTCELFAGPAQDLLPAFRLVVAIRNEQLSAFFRIDQARRDDGLKRDNLARLIGELQRSVGVNTEPSPTDPREAFEGLLLIAVTMTVFAAIYQVFARPAWWVRVPLAGLGALVAFGGMALLHQRAFPRRSGETPVEKAWETYELRVRPHLVEHIKAARLTSGELAQALDQSDEALRAEYRKVDPQGFVGKDMPLAFHSVGLLVMTH